MKKFSIVLIAILIVAALIIGYGISINNNFVTLEETINSNKAEIDNQLKRRADLIPNLVNTVKGLTSHEQNIIDSITESREKMLSGSTSEKLEANNKLSSNLAILVENYPQITSDKSFTSLMDELSGTENRITVARKNYNDNVSEYNKKIKVFPSNVIANMFGHEKFDYLQITESESQNVNVQF